MLRSRLSRSIMERYRRLRPVSLETPPSPMLRQEEEKTNFTPPSTSSYIRSTVPVSARAFLSGQVEQPTNPHRVRVALIGAPNAGKTSLLNQILKSQVGAVSSKANTTRESILGVLSRGNCQIEFVDCPGIVPINQSEECKGLSAKAWQNYNECDCVLFVVDTVKKPISEFLGIIRKIAPRCAIHQELASFETGDEQAQKLTKPVILVLNKADLVEDKKWLKVRNMQLSAHGNFETAFFVSAKEGWNVERLVDHVRAKAQPGDWQYPSSVVTTLSMTEQVEQLIRAFLFTWFNKDVPYTIAQQTVGWTERLDGTLIIEHELIVKDSVVARMILGSKNQLLSRLKDNVVYKLKQKWGMEKIVLLVHVKARNQRVSKRDKMQASQKASNSNFFSRGRGS